MTVLLLNFQKPSRLRPQQPADHFAGRGHGHRVDKRHLARIFVRRELCSHERLNVGGERIGRRREGLWKLRTNTVILVSRESPELLVWRLRWRTGDRVILGL